MNEQTKTSHSSGLAALVAALAVTAAGDARGDDAAFAAADRGLRWLLDHSIGERTDPIDSALLGQVLSRAARLSTDLSIDDGSSRGGRPTAGEVRAALDDVRGRLASAGVPEDRVAASLALEAFASSDEIPHREHYAKLRSALAQSETTLPRLGPNASVTRALQFLGAARSNVAASEPDFADSDWALSSYAGVRVERRRAFRALRDDFLDTSAFADLVGLPPLSRWHALHAIARVLASYKSPHRVGPGGDRIHWPTELARVIVAAPLANGAWPDDSGVASFTATCSAWLALDAVAPWIAVSESAIARAEAGEPRDYARLDVECETCHREIQPDLVHQWKQSRHAARGVGCADCHGLNHSTSFRENGKVSAGVCARCHERAAREFARSGHASAGVTLVSSALFASTPEARRESCFGCHRIGERHLDGSVGSCHHCHLGHRFDAAQAREPEACTICHTGDDYPQDLAYRGSKHGVLWAASRDERIAPTCVTCHLPDGTHDDRFGSTIGGTGTGGALESSDAPIAMRRVSPEDFRRARAEMIAVCARCHSSRFAESSLEAADRIKREGDRTLRAAVDLLEDLHADGILDIGAATSVGELPRSQIRVSPTRRDAAVLNTFYQMWRFDYQATWKGAYHHSPSVTNLHGRGGLEQRLEELRAAAIKLSEGTN